MPAPLAAVSTSLGGEDAPSRLRSVTSPVGTPPLRTFREVLYLRFTAGGLAEELALDPANTVFRAGFQPLEYNALQPGAPVAPAGRRTLDGALVVELEAPRRLLSVQLAPQKVQETGFTLLVHRLDGQAIAEKPTAAAAQAPEQTFHFDFTGALFALRLRDKTGQNVSLAIGDVRAVNVQADPAGARIGIALLPDPAEPGADPLAAPALFWPVSGDAVPTEADAGPALAEALERQLARLPALPAHVDAALVITADAPCRLVLETLEVPYRLVSRSLGSGAGKEVVRFAGAGAADRPLILQLPGGATVLSATLEAMPSLRGGRPVSGGAGTAAEPVEQTGARIDGHVWVAQRVAPPQAVTVLGIAMGLLGLTPGTGLTFEVREDHQGEPTGRTLAEGSLTLAQAGRRAWSTAFLSAPVILPAQPCWLLLTAAEGEAVWLTRGGETGVRLLDRPGTPSARQRNLQGLETLHRLLVAEDRQAEAAQTPALELRLGDTPVPELAEGGSGRKSFDLAAALTLHLSGQPAASLLDVPLNFTSTVPGSLTVYPPRITYEPG